MINAMVSRAIYKELSNGRVINKAIYDEERLKDNPLYRELFDAREKYAELYDALGFELIHKEGFFFIRDAEEVDPYREAMTKVVALLTVIGYGVMQLGFRFSLLIGEDAGISEAQAAELSAREDCRDILSAVGMKGDLWQECKNILVERRIAFINTHERIVLTDAGAFFFRELFSSGPLAGDETYESEEEEA